MRASRLLVATAILATSGVLGVSCGDGGTKELAADQKSSGPLPTAPDGSPRNGAGSNGDPFSGSVDVNDLIDRIEGLNSENDLCTLLTGNAMADIASADINLAGLASNPAGFSQLFAALNRLFGHMLTIAPSELTEPLTTLQGVWGGLADINIRASDAESRAASLLAGNETQKANDDLAAWVTSNCIPG